MIENSRIKRIHFVGIGGAGMSGIALVLHNMGFAISGSDMAENDTVRQLRGSGIPIGIGHAAKNVRDAEALVYSSAITPDNVELLEAHRRKIPVLPRAEMLAELMRMKYSIAIAGTHGKTTTTSMVATILSQAGLDPTFVVGGKLKAAGSGAQLGSSQYLVAEADESDGSFLRLLPMIGVVTNIENDHMEFYGNMLRLREAFTEFANRVPFYGAVIVNLDDPNSRRILPAISKKIVTFGLHPDADVRAAAVDVSAFSASYDLSLRGERSIRIELAVGGKHNVLNSLAAVAVAREIGIPIENILGSLKNFSLPERRMQVLYDVGSRLVVDDYAHHPSEIKAVLDTLKRSGCRRLIAVFQPHRYTRLKLLLPQFARCFGRADLVIIARLYSANQKTIRGVSSERLASEIRRRGRKKVIYFEEFPEITKMLQGTFGDGDALVFLSAGNLTRLAHDFAALQQEGPA